MTMTMAERSSKCKRFFVFFFVSGSELNRQLDKWLNDAELSFGPARAIIAP